MREKVKVQVTEGYNVAKEVVQGLEDFVIAISMLVAVYYNYDTLTPDKAPLEFYVRLVSSAVIGLFGTWLLVRAIRTKKD